MAWLELSTAKMGYMLSARDLSIIWGHDERFWRFVPGDGHSRFSYQSSSFYFSNCLFDAGKTFKRLFVQLEEILKEMIRCRYG